MSAEPSPPDALADGPTGAENWYRIRAYRDFWDVPRMLVVEAKGGLLLLDCEFDDEADDYRDCYCVYEMAEAEYEAIEGGDWTHAFAVGVAYVLLIARLASWLCGKPECEPSRNQAATVTADCA